MFSRRLNDASLGGADYTALAPVWLASQDEAYSRGDQVERELSRRFATLTVPGEVRRFDILADGLWATVASEARTADLLVALKP
jgi:hypothetical protein